MFRSLLITWAVLALAFAVTSWILDGLTVSGGVWGYIWVSALFGIVNAIIGTILRLLTLPLIILTLGLSESSSTRCSWSSPTGSAMT